MKKVSFAVLGLLTSLSGFSQCWDTVSRSIHHTMAIRSDGSLWAYGWNTIGELGLDSTIRFVDTFTRVGNDSNWKRVCAASGYTMALKKNNTLWSWGENGYATLGDGTTQIKFVPVQVGTNSDWVSFSSGQYHTMAIKQDGTLWGWGSCSNGMGNAMYESYKSPTQIGVDSNWLQVSVGSCFTIALKKDHTLWGWGENYYGQVGDGSGWFIVHPKQIGSDTNWLMIATGYYHSLAIKSNGTLWTWGEGYGGKLGNGSTANKLIPTQVMPTNTWRSIAGSVNHSLAIDNSRSLWASGRNAYGEVGDGTTIEKDSFVKIGTDSNWANISAGYGISNCIKTDHTLWATGIAEQINGGFMGTDTLISRNSFFTNKWVGVTDSLWHKSENWSCKCIPNEYSNVVIEHGSIYLNQNTRINSLTLGPLVALTIAVGVILEIMH